MKVNRSLFVTTTILAAASAFTTPYMMLPSFGPSSLLASRYHCYHGQYPTVVGVQVTILPSPKRTRPTTLLLSSLKPGAIPLMDSGKAMARSGELLIDVTKALDIYGGGLSSAGAQVRNAGDAMAQAAASARFKTGTELVIDELRECGTCLQAAADKLQRALEEALQDDDKALAETIESMIQPMNQCGVLLEKAGATVLQRAAPSVTGQALAAAGALLQEIAAAIPKLQPGNTDGDLSSQRLTFAAEKLILAGNELQGIVPNKAKGKSWLKGGGGAGAGL